MTGKKGELKFNVGISVKEMSSTASSIKLSEGKKRDQNNFRVKF